MPLDPINPIGPRPAAQPGQIPGVRRVDPTSEKREQRDDPPPRKRRQATTPDLPPPPDDGRPHVDVRV